MLGSFSSTCTQVYLVAASTLAQDKRADAIVVSDARWYLPQAPTPSR